MYARLHAPGYQDSTAELRIGSLFDKDAYVFRMRFAALTPSSS